jgi:hypothetical protein
MNKVTITAIIAIVAIFLISISLNINLGVSEDFTGAAYRRALPVNTMKSCEFITGGSKYHTQDRINIIFLNYGYSSHGQFLHHVKDTIDVSGEGLGINKYKGILGTEPYESNRNRFNFFQLTKTFDISSAGSKPKCSDVCRLPSEKELQDCNINGPYAIVAMCYANCMSDAGKGSGVFLSTKKFTEMNPTIAVHEFGHLWGLTDEYVEVSNPMDCTKKKCANIAPNCATLDFAKIWWGTFPGTNFYSGCKNLKGMYKPVDNTIMENNKFNSGYGIYNEAYICAMLKKTISPSYVHGICDKLKEPKSVVDLPWIKFKDVLKP